MMAASKGEILFLPHRMPYPPDRGDKIRSHHLLRALADIAPVHVGCFADDARDMGFSDELASVAASQCVVLRDRSRLSAGLQGLARRQPMLVSIYDNDRLRSWIGDILASRPIAAIVCYSVQMAQYVPAKLPDGCRFIMDFVDFDSAKYAAYGLEQRGIMGWINRREGRVLLDYERAVALRADVSTFVSAAEADLFKRAAGITGRDIRALENGVDLDHFDSSLTFPEPRSLTHPLIVFTGQMDYRPNIDAVTTFARGAFPRIRAEFANAEFAIVGRNPAPQVEALAALPGICVTGGVPDIRPWLAAADVVVAPLRLARGIQNKVLEAMAMGRPVVASVEAAEGIDAENGRHLLVAEGERAEADAVIRLLRAPERAADMGRAARKRMEQRYSWSAALAPLREIISGATA